MTGVLGGVFSLAAGFAAAAESSVLAAAFGIGATGLIVETPIASAVAHGLYSRSAFKENIATAESWEQLSANARAQGRCDAADEMDRMRAETVQDLDHMRDQAITGIVVDISLAAIESIVGLAGFRAVRF